jgi:uncharacterized protein (TIGR03083 family)
VDDLSSMARDERADFVDFLEQLPPQQWDRPTLCRSWRVRDVVGHVFSYDTVSAADLARAFVRGRFSLDRVNGILLAEHADKAPAELVALGRRSLEPRGLPAGFKGAIALVDAMIHQQDIRRPLGLPRTIPSDRLRAALDFAKTSPAIRGFWHRRGLRLSATDLEWSTGRGPEVRGTGEALLLAIAGRAATLDELDGPGQPLLRRRLEHG